jgi:DTW domain-containing protein YfiP
MLRALCVCALIPSPRLETRTRLVLFIHRREDRKPTNTGRLATECLANSEVLVRGERAHPSERFTCDAGSPAVLLFPQEGATPLAELAARTTRPVTLVVPDGTWRQASKVRKRVPGISELPCVWLPSAAPTTYRLRAESHEAGLATLEAIARAMGILEGTRVQRALERVFRAMVERTLWSRGELATEDVADGIPDVAAARDPKSWPRA